MTKAIWLGLWAATALAAAVRSETTDPAFYSYHERPGAPLPIRSVFHDEDDRTVSFADISRGLPLILVPAYFRCGNLCGVVRASLLKALRASGLKSGRDYALAVLSIDPTENGADARAAKGRDMAAFGLPGAGGYWHYLTGSATAVKSVADAVGFRDRFDPSTRQFIHPAGILFVSAEGIVSSYLLGVGYTPADIRSGVQRARAGRIAAVGSPVLLICFHFDPTTGRYSLEIVKVFRLAAALTVLTLAGMLVLLFRREGTRS